MCSALCVYHCQFDMLGLRSLHSCRCYMVEKLQSLIKSGLLLHCSNPEKLLTAYIYKPDCRTKRTVPEPDN